MMVLNRLAVLLLLGAQVEVASGSFVVNYMAEFTYFRGFFCFGPDPVLMAVCENGQIEAGETLPEEIVCELVEDSNDLPLDAASAVRCTMGSCDGESSCSDDSWRTISDLSNGNFGVIHYTCTGETAQDVGSYFAYLNEGTGGCAASTSIWLDNFNFHVARLSVWCPPFEGVEDFVNEDTFTECSQGFARPEILYSGPFDALNCISGDNCEFSSCDEVDYGDLKVLASPHMYEHCIQSDAVVPQIQEPQVEPAPMPGTYSATFAASFGFFMVDDEYWFDKSGLCSAETPTTSLRIVCEQGGTISFRDSSAPTMTCDHDGTDTSALICQDTEPLSRGDSNFGTDTSTYYNYFQQIEYECSTEDFYPTTTITYEQEELTCLDFYSTDTFVRHALQLGLYCGGQFTGQYYYEDTFAECQDAENEFIYLDEDADRYIIGEEPRFTCLGVPELLDYESYQYDREADGDYNEWMENRGIQATITSLTIQSEATYRFPGTDAANCLDFTASSSSSAASAAETPSEMPTTPNNATGTCTDTPNWADSANDTCTWYEDGDNCAVYGSGNAGADGTTAAESCCVCGGGTMVSSVVKSGKKWYDWLPGESGFGF
ncbi:expressed unknown protein [Seminavis robusta]|uniref:Uncharacterized protein n=1 Tax=Seminavis robusta TaxID=568900 RepID=A0A9N8HW12_9STRA|nr:expressed unknown protein [Seminavis robusta]|eukprot:Sro2105_g314740.1 n/a (603) ;mRNA; f:2250-4145